MTIPHLKHDFCNKGFLIKKCSKSVKKRRDKIKTKRKYRQTIGKQK